MNSDQACDNEVGVNEDCVVLVRSVSMRIVLMRSLRFLEFFFDLPDHEFHAG